jgi:hypothetical protein
MAAMDQRQLNQAAFRQLKDDIAKRYPPGRYVAISEGKILGDSDRFEELDTTLRKLGQTSTEVLVVQAGVDYPDFVTVFI